MDIRLANDILKITDFKTLQILNEYFDFEISEQVKVLKRASDFNQVLKAQGAIGVLDGLKKIRENCERVTANKTG